MKLKEMDHFIECMEILIEFFGENNIGSYDENPLPGDFVKSLSDCEMTDYEYFDNTGSLDFSFKYSADCPLNGSDDFYWIFFGNEKNKNLNCFRVELCKNYAIMKLTIRSKKMPPYIRGLKDESNMIYFGCIYDNVDERTLHDADKLDFMTIEEFKKHLDDNRKSGGPIGVETD